MKNENKGAMQDIENNYTTHSDINTINNDNNNNNNNNIKKIIVIKSKLILRDIINMG